MLPCLEKKNQDHCPAADIAGGDCGSVSALVNSTLADIFSVSTCVAPTKHLDERVALSLGLATNTVLVALTGTRPSTLPIPLNSPCIVGRIIYASTTFTKRFGIQTVGPYHKTALRTVSVILSLNRTPGSYLASIQSSILYGVAALLVLISRSINHGDNFMYFFAVGAIRHVVVCCSSIFRGPA
jgi:hypothetical protein